jgi:hypothetical protein
MFQNNLFKPSKQAIAVKAYLEMHDGIEATYDVNTHRYQNVHIGPWFNGRERGFVITMNHNFGGESINIAFYEHRSSDDIIVLTWTSKRLAINPPTLADAPWNTGEESSEAVFSYGKASEAADHIYKVLSEWWMGEA